MPIYANPSSQSAHTKKLSRLPKNAKIHKRPLLRPQIANPYSSRQNQKVVYLSSKTPFMSAVKRVKALVAHIDKRTTQSELSQRSKARRKGQAADSKPKSRTIAAEPVVVKATGRAIQKALGLGLFLQADEALDVRVRTGTVSAVDDIEVRDDWDSGDHENTEAQNGGDEGGVAVGGEEHSAVAVDDKSNADLADLPESRIRNTSVVEVWVSLKRT